MNNSSYTNFDNKKLSNLEIGDCSGEAFALKNAEETEISYQETEKDNGLSYLTREELAEFLRRFSGRDANGESKVVISYQTYALEEPDGSADKERIYTTKKPHIELSVDPNFPEFFELDIIFRSYEDPELKMLWGRLQRFKRNMANEGEKTWIFYFNILEKSGLTSQTEKRDVLRICNVFNPSIFYLTREIPNLLVEDTMSTDGTLYGGNVIKMLVPAQLLTFDITDNVDTSLIKAEAMREEDARQYTDNPENRSTWSE